MAYDVPFAINSLTLTGRLEKTIYNGVNITCPLYPLPTSGINVNKIPVRKGIKASIEYYPFKSVFFDMIFLATNGTKVLFRGLVEEPPKVGVLTDPG